MSQTPPAEPRSVRRTVSGWGRYPRVETNLYRPERMPALRALLEANETSLLARGLGASYGDASLNGQGGTVLTERLNRFLSLDTETGIVSCEAGVTIEDLLRHLLPRGFFPPVSPGTKYVTLGGCVACDVHGKNHHRSGSFSRHLIDFQLLTAAGEVVRCSREERPKLFWATVGGMGLTGVISELRFRMMPVETPFLAVDFDRAENLDAALQLFEGDEDYTHSVAWLDGLARGASLGRSVVMRANQMDRSTANARGLGVARWSTRRTVTVPPGIPSWTLNAWTVRAFNTLYYHRHPRRARRLTVHYDKYFYPLDRILKWNRLYGPRGLLQYQCVVPLDGGRDALVRLLEAVSRSQRASFLAVLKRFGPTESEQMLSFPRPGYTLALDFRRDAGGVMALLDSLDRIVGECGGRVYLAKDARLTRERFEAMYPEVARWREVKGAVDPENRFRSDLGVRLGLVP